LRAEAGKDRIHVEAEVGHEAEFAATIADIQAMQRSDDPPAAPLRIAMREDPPSEYLGSVALALQHIAAGDIYQANLSRAWRGEYPQEQPSAIARLYRQLRAANPAPFASLLQIGRFAILSSSPERMIAVDGRTASTRPIAGTRPRTRVASADAAEIAALIAHPKERAEHIMLIDLERNDLGKVCEGGSVEVDEFLTVESYQHVHHIVSSVRGQLRPEVTPIDALRAVFPGGTITGVPKFRCMQIIAALEGGGRGAYTGSLGYLGRDGRADFNILIRSIVIDGGRIGFRAGAGIVADSDAQRELEETRAKARGMLAALDPGA
jgi:anthranilate synthase component I